MTLIRYRQFFLALLLTTLLAACSPPAPGPSGPPAGKPITMRTGFSGKAALATVLAASSRAAMAAFVLNMRVSCCYGLNTHDKQRHGAASW